MSKVCVCRKNRKRNLFNVEEKRMYNGGAHNFVVHIKARIAVPHVGEGLWWTSAASENGG